MNQEQQDFIQFILSSETPAERSVRGVQYALGISLAVCGERDTLEKLLETTDFRLSAEEILDTVQKKLDGGVLDRALAISLIGQLLCSDGSRQKGLGLLLSGLFEADFKPLILSYCAQPAYSFLALYAASRFADANAFFWDLLERMCNLTTTQALYFFHPVTPQQQQWIMETGQYQPVLPEFAAGFCLERTELLEYYLRFGVNASNFSHYSHLLAFGSLLRNIKSYGITALLVKDYLEFALTARLKDIDLAALSMLALNVDPNDRGKDPRNYETPHANESIPKENGWSTGLESLVRCHTMDILLQRKTFDRVLCCLHDAALDTRLLFYMTYFQDAFNACGFTIGFRHYRAVLEKSPFLEPLLKLLESRHLGKMDFDDLQAYLKSRRKDWMNPAPEKKELLARWLRLYLKYAKFYGEYRESLVVNMLSFGDIAVSKAVLRLLRATRSDWSEAVAPAIQNWADTVTDRKLKSEALRLLNSEPPEKKKEFFDISHQSVTAVSILGQFPVLFHVNVVGMTFRDQAQTVLELEAGFLLRLKRESENPYDKNAVLVLTASGYAIGYIPRVSNEALAEAMDAGQVFYAVVEEVSLERKFLRIGICRSIQEV